MAENRRSNDRLNLLCGARIRSDNLVHEVVVHDLNRLGCRITSPVSLQDRTRIGLQVGLEGRGEPFDIVGEVAWCAPITFSSSFQIGVNFLEFPTPQHFQELSLLVEQERLRRESRNALERSLGGSELSRLSDLEAQRIAFLARLSRYLNRSHDPNETAEAAVSAIAEVMRAERVMLMLDRGGAEPEVLAALGTGDGPYRYSRSVVEKVLKEGEAILSFDVPNDVQLDAAKSLNLLGTRSILCIPLFFHQKVAGLLYMDNGAQKAAFSQSDLEIASVLAELAAAAIERGQYFSMLVQTEKMSALGVLTASLAHELNNPLTVIAGAAEMLREEPDDPVMIEALLEGVDRCKTLVSDVTSWSRTESTPPEEVRVEEIVEATLPLIRSEAARTGTTIEVDYEGYLPPVKGHVNALSQVLLNLFANAIQVLEGREDRRVAVQVSASDTELFLRVKDSGPGIPPQNLARIFDPFFTTKPKGRGTGLGLSISRDIMSRYGGRLEVRNLPGGGAQFLMVLPAVVKVKEGTRPH